MHLHYKNLDLLIIVLFLTKFLKGIHELKGSRFDHYIVILDYMQNN